ncbi:three-Cys-motif partner protein TcmP [Pontibacter arcticus]|uniref:Three-Cys-motif partner protein n=1 Tax=Pontibacter arcticus TaxID=2080288 RepID=A0A364RI56_9BACT|nr:three-Cys-motif partner protein TcmP [Pontibacter arcticus]RAU83989.1 hypothetical protein DP923_02705 [Pontibacter arcticus]
MADIKPNDFFKKERSLSAIKTEILSQYFVVWCKVILSNQRERLSPAILYFDLSAGQGPAALFKILDTIFRSSGTNFDLNKAVQVIFHDPAETTLAELEESINNLPYYDALVHKPIRFPAAENEELLPEQIGTGLPALAFLNPFQDVVAQEFILGLGQRWNADLVMLFDFESINAAVKTKKPSPQLQELFSEKLTDIKAYYKTVRDAAKREAFALATFKTVFAAKGYTLFEFRINAFDKKQTNQYLLLAVKTDAAYTSLKELMLGYTEFQEDAVPLFGANLQQNQMGLFQEYYMYSVVNLVDTILQKASVYNNKTLQSIYEKDNVGTNYSRDNYKVAYQILKQQGKVIFVNPKTGQTISALTYTSIIRYKK